MGLVGTIINITFIVIFLISIGLGFLSGFWKKLRSLIGLAIGILLLIILINPIAKGIVNADLPVVGESISDLVVESISEGLEEGKELPANGEVALLCNSVALSIAKMVVLLIGTTVIFAVIIPITKLILRLIMGKDEHEKSIGMRFAGLGIAAAEFLIGCFLITLPIYGATTLVMDYEDVLKASEETEQIIEVVEIVDNTIPNKINKIFGKNMPVNALGSFTKAKNKNGTINIIKEVQNAKPVVSTIIEAENEYDGDFLKAAIKNREELVEFIKNTNILETFMPAVIEILEVNDSIEDIYIVELKNIDFAEDKKHLADIVSVVFQFIEKTNLDLENPTEVLGNENLPSSLKDLGEALKDATFLKLLLGLLQGVLDDALAASQDELGAIVEILDVTKIEKENIPNDFYNLGIIANTIAHMGLLEEEANIFGNPQELKNLVIAIFDISLIKGNEEKVIDSLLNNMGLKESFTDLGIELDYTNVLWDQEKVAIGNIALSVGTAYNSIENFDLENIYQYFEDETTRPYLIDVIVSFTESSLIGKDFIISIIDNAVNLVDYGVDLKELDLDKVVSWEAEIESLVELIDIIQTSNIDITKMTEEEIEEIILIATGTKEEPCFIASYILGAIVNRELENFIGEEAYNEFHQNHDFTDPNVLRESVKDIVTIIALSKNFVETPDIEDWSKEEVKDFCDSIASIDVKNDEATVTILHEIAKDSNIDVTKEDIKNADIKAEAALLEEILTAINTNKSDAEIDALVKQAEEESVIIVAVIEKYFR